MPVAARRVLRKRNARCRRSKLLGWSMKNDLAALQSQDTTKYLLPAGYLDSGGHLSQLLEEAGSACHATQARCRQCYLKSSAAAVYHDTAILTKHLTQILGLIQRMIGDVSSIEPKQSSNTLDKHQPLVGSSASSEPQVRLANQDTREFSHFSFGFQENRPALLASIDKSSQFQTDLTTSMTVDPKAISTEATKIETRNSSKEATSISETQDRSKSEEYLVPLESSLLLDEDWTWASPHPLFSGIGVGILKRP